MLDVNIDVVGGKVGGGEVELGVARVGMRNEGNIPAENKALEELDPVEVGPEGRLPGGNVEGRNGERNFEPVHICRFSRQRAGMEDPLKVLLLIGRTRSEREVVARARLGR